MSTSEDLLRSQYSLEGPLPNEPPFENDLKFLTTGLESAVGSGSVNAEESKDQEIPTGQPASQPASRPSDNRFVREEPW